MLNKKWYLTLLVLIIVICAFKTVIQKIYYSKYVAIDLSSKENIILNLKTDISLLDEVKEELFAIEKNDIRIEVKGKNGYKEYDSEQIKKLFQKYGLRSIDFIKNKNDIISCSINEKYDKKTTYSGFYFSMDGMPVGYYSDEGWPRLQKIDKGYQQVQPGYFTYYTEWVGGSWYYYEAIFYRGGVL